MGKYFIIIVQILDSTNLFVNGVRHLLLSQELKAIKAKILSSYF